MSEQSIAPWTDEEVRSLNEFQASGVMHPFTCENDDADYCSSVLVATTDGWTCPDCDYTQNWAKDWMVDGAWRQLLPDYDPGPSYAEIVNAPMSEATIEALAVALKSGDVPRRKVKVRKSDAQA